MTDAQHSRVLQIHFCEANSILHLITGARRKFLCGSPGRFQARRRKWFPHTSQNPEVKTKSPTDSDHFQHLSSKNKSANSKTLSTGRQNSTKQQRELLPFIESVLFVQNNFPKKSEKHKLPAKKLSNTKVI